MSTSPVSVSVIVVALNGRAWLNDAVDSVVSQTYSDWELILCDDGSSDGTDLEMRRYAMRVPGRIVYCEHESHRNCGISASRMLGVRNSTGRFISWLDADDVYHPEKLQRQVTLFTEHPKAAMVYGPLIYWYSWNNQSAPDIRQDIGVAVNRVHGPPAVLRKVICNPEHNPGGVMVRRDILEAVGGYEVEFRGDYEDVVAQSKILLEWPVYAHSQCLYWYRQHDRSCTATVEREGHAMRNRLSYVNWMIDYIRKQRVQRAHHGSVLRVATRVRGVLEKAR